MERNPRWVHTPFPEALEGVLGLPRVQYAPDDRGLFYEGDDFHLSIALRTHHGIDVPDSLEKSSLHLSSSAGV